MRSCAGTRIPASLPVPDRGHRWRTPLRLHCEAPTPVRTRARGPCGAPTQAPRAMLAQPHERRLHYLARVDEAGVDHLAVGDHVSFHVGAGFDGLVQATALLAAQPRMPVTVAVPVCEVLQSQGAAVTFGASRPDRLLVRGRLPPRIVRFGARNLVRNKRRTAATTLQIALAVATRVGVPQHGDLVPPPTSPAGPARSAPPCRRLAVAGRSVVVVDLDAAAAEQVASELAGSGQQGIGLDMSDAEAVHQDLARVEADAGGVRTPVNASGWDRPTRCLPPVRERPFGSVPTQDGGTVARLAPPGADCVGADRGHSDVQRWRRSCIPPDPRADTRGSRPVGPTRWRVWKTGR